MNAPLPQYELTRVAMGVRVALYRMAQGTHTLRGDAVRLDQPSADILGVTNWIDRDTVQSGPDHQS